jgi:hypothetical protein
MTNGVATSPPATTPTAPSAGLTILSVRGDMTISEEKVAVDAVFGNNEFFVQLSKEAFIGSPMSVAYWLRETYAVEGDGIDWLTLKAAGYEDSTKFAKEYRNFTTGTGRVSERKLYKDIQAHLKLKGCPPQAMVIMTTAMLAEVSITDLLIKIKGPDKKIMFGIAIYFRAPLPLLPNIYVDKLSFLLMHSSNGKFDDFPKRMEQLGPPAPAEDIKATGFIKFIKLPTGEDQITLGGEQWGFGGTQDAAKKITKIGADIPETVASLAADLSAAKQDKIISKCTYTVKDTEKDKIIITFNESGSAGNDFQLNVPEDLGEASATTLRGGGGAPEVKVGKKATGTIKFTKLEAGNKIKLGGVDWEIVAKGADPKEGTTKVGDDLAGTVRKLAVDLNNSAKTEITVCTYTATASNKVDQKIDTLSIEYNEGGVAGNDFTWAVPTTGVATTTTGQLADGAEPT